MTTLHLTLKMTTAWVVETSVTNNSLSKDYLTRMIMLNIYNLQLNILNKLPNLYVDLENELI